MFRIRLVPDDLTPANRTAIAETQAILVEQFPAVPPTEAATLAERLRDPLKHGFVSRLFVAEDARERTRGFALLLYMADLNFCYLDYIAAAPGRMGGGLGDALYERARDEAIGLGAIGVFLECLPDDPALSPDPKIRAQSAARLKFYERFGARPIAGTGYETPLKPGGTNPPYLVFDGLGRDGTPSLKVARAVVRAILERKYSLPKPYVDKVVASFKDDPIRLREPLYVKAPGPAPAPRGPLDRGIPLVVNSGHEIHHVRDRGYVEAPVRLSSIVRELNKTSLFRGVEPRHHSDRHIRAVHEGSLVDYLERTCATLEPGRSVYPYVFPVRNAARAPKDATVRAGYFCIDTFTPLNSNAFKAARGAVDCALTAAREVLEGSRLAYALVRPPGHHAERKAFGGFCYFNNAAIAANYLSQYGRIAVLDIDYHHGNGTQDIFFERADVLTISIHGHPRFAFPYFSGFRDETGSGPGAGYNINYPLPETTTPAAYAETLGRALRRIADFGPAYLVVALGLDTAKGDPTGTWSHTGKDFEAIGRRIGAAGYPTLVVQEGGYRVRTLGSNARHFFVGLAQGAAEARPPKPRGPAEALPQEGIAWREAVRRSDIEAVRRLVAATGYFNTGEVEVAAELVEERVKRGPRSGYEFVVAESGGRLVGYAAYGPIAGADGRYDLYWIVVDRQMQGRGLGRRILKRVEDLVAAKGGKRVYVDTAGRALYAPTRAFYARAGYRKVGELADFYSPGDGKVIFQKDL